MAGNLGAIGLELDVRSVVRPLGDRRFLLFVMVWNWLVCPALALAIVRLLPIADAYAVGLLLVGLAPAAPFLPMVVRRAGGDPGHTAAFLLISALGTIALMPLALPAIAPGLAVDRWTIARPLLVLLLAPLCLGMALCVLWPAVAATLRKGVKLLADASTIGLLIAIVTVYFKSFLDAIGSFAIAAHLIFTVGVLAGSWVSARSLPPSQRSVLSLGVGTRNFGAAFSPLLAGVTDPRTTVMIALGVPITLLLTFAVAGRMGHRADAPVPEGESKR